MASRQRPAREHAERAEVNTWTSVASEGAFTWGGSAQGSGLGLGLGPGEISRGELTSSCSAFFHPSSGVAAHAATAAFRQCEFGCAPGFGLGFGSGLGMGLGLGF